MAPARAKSISATGDTLASAVGNLRKRKADCPKLGGEVVEIRIGAKEELFNVHKELLCSPSAFFERACNGPWKEANERLIKLPEQQPQIFKHYVHWLYSGALYVKETENPSAYKDISIYNEEEQLLCKLYFLGDQIQDSFFRNCVIDAICDLAEEAPRAPGSVTLIYDNTLAGDKLSMLVVDMHVWLAHPGWIKEVTWDNQKSTGRIGATKR